MAKKTANIIVRIEPEVKAEAEAVLDDIGISLSAAVNMFLKQLIRTGGIPFEINSRREENIAVGNVDVPKETVVEEVKPEVEPKVATQEEIIQETAEQEVIVEPEIADSVATETEEEETIDEDIAESTPKIDDFAFPSKLSKIVTVINR